MTVSNLQIEEVEASRIHLRAAESVIEALSKKDALSEQERSCYDAALSYVEISMTHGIILTDSEGIEQCTNKS